MVWHVAAADLIPPVLLTTPKRPSTPLNPILLSWLRYESSECPVRSPGPPHPIPKAHHPQPDGISERLQRPKFSRIVQGYQPGAVWLKQHGTEATAVPPARDVEVGWQIGRPLLQEVGIQSTRGGAQHVGFSSGACQRIKS